jgi:hypothetical protein
VTDVDGEIVGLPRLMLGLSERLTLVNYGLFDGCIDGKADGQLDGCLLGGLVGSMEGSTVG